MTYQNPQEYQDKILTFMGNLSSGSSYRKDIHRQIRNNGDIPIIGQLIQIHRQASERNEIYQLYIRCKNQDSLFNFCY